jgi:hypothetical protein
VREKESGISMATSERGTIGNGRLGNRLPQEIFEMATFRHVRTECQCADEEVNPRIFWLDPGNPGRVYAYLAPDDAVGAADQFSRYGILEEMELPGPGDDRISAVTFECDLAVMIEKMLDGGFSDPEKEMTDWLLVLQHCSKRLGEELLKVQGEEGPPPRL